MKRVGWPAVLWLPFLLIPACGKKGSIQPPLVLVPQQVETLKAFQRGSRIVLEWTNPESYIDGRPLAGISEVEVWLEERSAKPSPAAAIPHGGSFDARAKRAAVIKPEGKTPILSFFYPLDSSAGWADKTFVFAVRVREAGKRRLSDFSDEVAVKPQPLPSPPSRVWAEVFVDRIDVRWDAPAANFDGSSPARIKGYNVYRIDKSGKLLCLTAAPISETVFADRDFLFGQAYRYLVRAVALAAEQPLESEDSPPVDVLPRDLFSPAVPTGLTIAKGSDFITLVWDANKEKDLAGYNVWRREEGATDFSCLTKPPLVGTTYTDRTVEKGKRYEYAVTAVDGLGNESPKSAVVSDIIKEP